MRLIVRALVSALSDVNRRLMARDESENFRIRAGRSRNGGARINPRTQPFLKQVQIAVGKAGGDPRRIGSGARTGGGWEGRRSGRSNARGRGAKVVASFARQGAWWVAERFRRSLPGAASGGQSKGGPAQSAPPWCTGAEDEQGRRCSSALP